MKNKILFVLCFLVVTTACKKRSYHITAGPDIPVEWKAQIESREYHEGTDTLYSDSAGTVTIEIASGAISKMHFNYEDENQKISEDITYAEKPKGGQRPPKKDCSTAYSDCIHASNCGALRNPNVPDNQNQRFRSCILNCLAAKAKCDATNIGSSGGLVIQ